MSEQPPWRELLDFWFGDSVRDQRSLEARVRIWFRSEPEFDREIERRFGHLVEQALTGELANWEDDPHGRLALVLLLDQFTRNIHRGTARAFAGDARALGLVRDAIAAGDREHLAPIERAFLGLPLEHAEDLDVQTLSVAQARGNLEGVASGALRHHLERFLQAAEEHAETVRRFGRYPHRNKALGRESTAEESAWLAEGGKGWGQ